MRQRAIEWVRASVMCAACAACAVTVQCKTSGSRAAAAGDAAAPVAKETDEDAGGEPMSDEERAAWTDADGGEPAEMIRLADRVGCSGLRERASSPPLRALAVKAMRYCTDFSELPWLADLAATGSDPIAADALDSIVDQAARPRRAVDPEDADELHAGCASLLALARSVPAPRARRVGAVRALRMLADRGCVQRTDIPSDVDAK